MQRSSVVLPESLGPITTTASPAATDSDTPRNTWLAPKFFTMPSIASIGRVDAGGASVIGTSVTNEGAPLKEPSVQGQGVADAEIDQCGTEEDLERRQGAFHHLTAGHRQLPQPNDGHQRGGLYQIDAQADEG